MHRHVSQFATTLATLLVFLGQSAVARDWIDDLDQSKSLAEKESKDLIIVFTGTAWCGSCIALKREALDQPDFALVRDSFVVVVLEYPQATKDLPVGKREKYVAWQAKYGIHSFPTMILADVAGKPYAFTGYSRGLAAKEYLRQFHRLQGVRRQRDAAFAKAASAQGAEKAKYLDEALTAMRQGFPEDKIDRFGDALVRFYRPEIDEILAIDVKNEAGLRDKYSKVLGADAERKQTADVLARIAAVYRTDGCDKAIRLIDQELPKAKSAELRKQLQYTRRVYLEWSDRYDDALAYTKEMLKDPALSLSSEERLRLRERIAFNLWRLKRIDESIAVYDDLIAQAAGNARMVWGFHRDKADVLMRAGRLREALETWTLARKYVKKGSDDWLTTEALRIHVLMKMQRFAEADAACEDLAKGGDVKPLELAGILSSQAWRFKDAGRAREALEKAAAAGKLLATVKPDRVEQAEVDEIRHRIETLREKIKTGDSQTKQP